MIEIGNELLAICDNLDFVSNLSWLLEDNYNNHGLHKSTEQDTKQHCSIKNNNIILLNNITKHKTKLLHTKQQHNKIRHKNVISTMIL